MDASLTNKTMTDLTDTGKNEKFAAYAEKHELFDLFQSSVSKLLIAKPADPYQFLIDTFSKQQECIVPILTVLARSIILLAPPIAGLKITVSSCV